MRFRFPSSRRGRWALGIAVVVLIAAIASSSSKKSSSKGGSATTHQAQASTRAKPKRGLSGTQRDALSYVSSLGIDANRVQATVQTVLIAVGDLQQAPTQANLNQAALYAQKAHDNIDGIRDDFANTTADSGSPLGDAQLEVFTAAGDLRDAMSALVGYTGNSNPASLAQFTTKYQTAKSEWNDGLRIIWRAAHKKHPPTV